MTPLRFVLLFTLLFTQVLKAEVTCPAIFGDHMVLQRDRPVKIWGTALAGECVVVHFGEQEHSTQAGDDGAWSVMLSPLKASFTPRSLWIFGSNTLQFSDVLVGEVWLCSGQSNMEKQIGPRAGQKPTDNWEQELAASGCPTLRLFQMPRRGKLKPSELGLCWVPSSPENLKATAFSAAAWHFGRELSRVLGVPIGLIHSSYGGTRIEAWTPHEAFERAPSLAAFFKAPAGSKVDRVETCSLYDTMIAPLAPYTLRGFLWYQGESNCMNTDTWIYTDKMKALIEGWRTVWQLPEAPFYYVYLAPWQYSKRESKQPLTTLALPMLWEAQVKALAIPYTGLVPSSDISPDVGDIHPTNKRDVGLRLARLALSRDYRIDQGLVEAPRFEGMHCEKETVRIDFIHAEGGLKTRDGKAPSEFSIAGADQVFYPAMAVIKGSSVELSSPAVKEPVAVRHGFHETSFPNLVNQGGLPALPFRTDSWPVAVERSAEENKAPVTETKPGTPQ